MSERCIYKLIYRSIFCRYIRFVVHLTSYTILFEGVFFNRQQYRPDTKCYVLASLGI